MVTAALCSSWNSSREREGELVWRGEWMHGVSSIDVVRLEGSGGSWRPGACRGGGGGVGGFPPSSLEARGWGIRPCCPFGMGPKASGPGRWASFALFPDFLLILSALC